MGTDFTKLDLFFIISTSLCCPLNNEFKSLRNLIYLYSQPGLNILSCHLLNRYKSSFISDSYTIFHTLFISPDVNREFNLLIAIINRHFRSVVPQVFPVVIPLPRMSQCLHSQFKRIAIKAI